MAKPIVPINDTTFEVELPGGDKVEIGDRDAAVFKPHLKLNRWGGECFIKVGLPTTEKPAPIIEEDKVKSKGKDLEAHFYPLEPRTVIAKDKDGKDAEFIQNELGGFEFEVILKKKPKTNKIVLNIETQGLVFYRQQALSQEDIAGGALRPDNVVGSYAVYHATKRDHIVGQTNYMCGKAFHIYRPKITDADGKWVWGELSIDEQAGTLTITIPQEFLDNAVYPIYHATGLTFGFEDPGGSLQAIADRITGSQFTGAAGTASKVTVYQGLGNAGQPGKGVIYNHGTLARVSITDQANFGGVDNWWDFTFSTPPTIEAIDYILAANSDQTMPAEISMSWDDGVGTTQGHYDEEPYDTWPDPLVPTHEDRKYSIYCTYEPPAGWTGKISGVTDPAKVMGVDVANIAEVKGVT